MSNLFLSYVEDNFSALKLHGRVDIKRHWGVHCRVLRLYIHVPFPMRQQTLKPSLGFHWSSHNLIRLSTRAFKWEQQLSAACLCRVEQTGDWCCVFRDVGFSWQRPDVEEVSVHHDEERSRTRRPEAEVEVAADATEQGGQEMAGSLNGSHLSKAFKCSKFAQLKNISGIKYFGQVSKSSHCRKMSCEWNKYSGKRGTFLNNKLMEILFGIKAFRHYSMINVLTVVFNCFFLSCVLFDCD